jgi:hypothetical protein
MNSGLLVNGHACWYFVGVLSKHTKTRAIEIFSLLFGRIVCQSECQTDFARGSVDWSKITKQNMRCDAIRKLVVLQNMH